MSSSDSAQVALVQWASTFPLDKKADSISDFLDGNLLGQVLRDLDSTYDFYTGEGKLYDVYKGITRLVNRECPGLIRQTKLADIRPRAREAHPEAISKLLSVLFGIAMLGSNNERYVMRITHDITDKTNLMQLQRITQDMKAAMEEAEALDLEEASEIGHNSHEADLAMEAENIRLRSDLDRKVKLLADMETRLGHLQESYDDLKEEVVRKGRELETYHNAQDGAGKDVIRSLELKLREQDELIANHEAQAEDDRMARERLMSEVSMLKVKTQKLESLDDEVKELRFKNEELSRKANMVERYKQKLEAQSTLTKEMDNLLYEREQMHRDLVDYEKMLKRNQALEQTNEQYASKLRDYELQYVELDAQRRALHDDTQQLRARLVTLDAQRLSDERLIVELQEQINSGPQTSLSTEAGTTGFTLEDELEGASGSTTPNPALEISRLKAENSLLRSGIGSASENVRLRQELEEERKQRERIQGTYMDTFEKHQLAEAQISAFIQSSSGSEMLTNLKIHMAQKNHEFESGKRRLNEIEAQLADKDRELLCARTDLSAVAKDSVEALKALKSTDQFISSSIREELEATRQKLKSLSSDFEEQRSSLINALLEKDKLRKDLDEAKEGRQEGAKPTEVVQKLQDKVEKLRVRLKERTAQSEKSEQDKYDLRRKLKAVEQGEAAAAQKAASDQIIRDLQRENALIATAWYDLSSRVQSNYVVLQRRNEASRSWLGKQRQMLNATPRK